MVLLRRGLALVACAPLIGFAAPVAAQNTDVCRVIDVDFTPGGIAAGVRTNPGDPSKMSASPEITPQIVAWLETPTGQYVDTIYITAATGRYGLGNRPGRFDFNSGPLWPYGRRTTTFPVWAGRHGKTFPQLEFQGGTDNDLSHSSGQSSREVHFCRPMEFAERGWDSATCASAQSFTDKGQFSTRESSYPPRADVVPVNGTDSMSAGQYKQMNPFDAVSAATPRLGAASQMNWSTNLAGGDYVLFVEVALEQDFNTAFPPNKSPEVAYGDYGVPYMGQPSVVYRLPIKLSADENIAMVDQYAGYSDPAHPGSILLPDASMITEGVANTGAGRLLMMSQNGQMFRLRVSARPELDHVLPGAPGEMEVVEPSLNGATLKFLAPGDDGQLGRVSGYEIRYRAGGPITEANFNDMSEIKTQIEVAAPGQMQQITLKDLLPETEYTVAVRAFDDCRNYGALQTVTFSTGERRSGSVDACFVATAAYGSLLANDVELLRRFRDNLLRRTALGELAVETYYTFGPSVAGVVGESDLLRETARDLLAPVVQRVKRVAF